MLSGLSWLNCLAYYLFFLVYGKFNHSAVLLCEYFDTVDLN